MSRRLPVALGLAFVLGFAVASPARADITAFFGASHVSTPTLAASGTDSDSEFRTARGVAVGFSLVIVGFEFEWASTSGDDSQCAGHADFRTFCAPSLSTGMANVLLQTPHGLSPVQVYGTVGAGVYREHYALEEVLGVPDENDYGMGTNVGGGVKVDLIGPLRLRLDYRIFKLANDAFNSTPQRFYAGANLAF